jgi:Protein of unknown function (DUF3631)
MSGDARQSERMLAEVYGFLGRFVSYPSEHAHLAHALWCVHTHLMDKWESTPRIAFLSPEPASGKSRALEITELLVPNPVAAINVSPAYLFRKIGDEEGVTLLYDEIDTVFGPRAREHEELRGLLNAGHRRGAVAGRCVVRGNVIETEEIPAYAAVAMAGLGWLPDTIMSRSVIVRMRRRHEGERVEPYRRRIHAAEGYQIRDMTAAWAASATINWPKLPPGIQDREADVWEPLIAVAEAIGAQWPERATQAALALVAESKEDDTSLGIRLLADIRVIFGDATELPTKTILDRLCELPESPWADIKGKPLDDRRLAGRLRPYRIKPKQIRVGTATPRGYCRADFEEQWRSYLPPLPQKAKTSETTKTLRENGAAVLNVLDFATKAGDPVTQPQCAQCHRGGDVIQCAYGAVETWLHRDCIIRLRSRLCEAGSAANEWAPHRSQPGIQYSGTTACRSCTEICGASGPWRARVSYRRRIDELRRRYKAIAQTSRIGMVVVAAFAASAAGVLVAAITATFL